MRDHRPVWTTDERQAVDRVLRQYGASKAGAVALVQALPEVSPKRILTLVMNSRDVSRSKEFNEYLLSASVRWTNCRYQGRVIHNGQRWVGISVLGAKIQQTYSEEQLQAAGLPVYFRAHQLREWLRDELKLEASQLQGKWVYPLSPVLRRISSPCVKRESDEEVIARALESRRAKLTQAVADAQRELHVAQEARNAAYAKFEAAEADLRRFITRLQALSD